MEKEALQLQADMAGAGKTITFTEAMRRTEAKYAPDEPEDEPAPIATETQPSRRQILEQEITGLKEKLVQAGKESALYTEDLANAQIELAEKVADLKSLTATEQANSHVNVAMVRAAQETSKSEMLAKYPSAGDSNTAFGAFVAQRIVDLKSQAAGGGAEGAKAIAILNSPKGPEIITEGAAKDFANSLKVTMNVPFERALDMISARKAPAPAPIPASNEPKSPPRALAVTASGAAPTQAQTPPVTQEELMDESLMNPDAAAAKAWGGASASSITFGR